MAGGGRHASTATPCGSRGRACSFNWPNHSAPFVSSSNHSRKCQDSYGISYFAKGHGRVVPRSPQTDGRRCSIRLRFRSAPTAPTARTTWAKADCEGCSVACIRRSIAERRQNPERGLVAQHIVSLEWLPLRGERRLLRRPASFTGRIWCLAPNGETGRVRATRSRTGTGSRAC